MMTKKKDLPFEKSFASCDKAKYWHSEKNGDIKPSDITIRTATKYWFICNNPECGHEFLTSPDKIASGNWCVYCCVPPQKLCDEDNNCDKCFKKSFASHEKAKYWSDKNELNPLEVFISSNSKFWFNCDKCMHEFDSVLGSITSGRWCGYCSHDRLCDAENCNMCYENSFASHPKAVYWDYDMNGNIKPRDVFKNNNKKYFFTCNDCHHIFDVSLSNLSAIKERWCPYCGRNKLCDDVNCQRCFNGSFASHNKSKLWSSKNGVLTPRQITKSSGKKYWFTCETCIHDFEMAISHIIRNDSEKTCPICSSQYLCKDEDCNICFEKSFASHPKFVFLDKEKHKDINFKKIFKSSNTKYWFNCNCGHSNEMTLNSVSSGSWCSYCCVPQLKLCENEDCNRCFEKSFASHPRVKFLIDDDINPRSIFKGSQRKLNFKCEKGHKFLKQISIIGENFGWCPQCLRKSESLLYKKLGAIYENLLFQYRPEWCKNEATNCHMPFDFALEKEKIIIELDGAQHFRQVRKWGNPEENQKRDKLKMAKANENGFSVIRITQQYLTIKNSDWFEELKRNIDKVISDGKIQNVYICKNNEYEIFLK